MTLVDVRDDIAGWFCPIVEYYHLLSADWPHQASTPASKAYLSESKRALFLHGPRFSTLESYPAAIDAALDKQRKELRQLVKGQWACHISLWGDPGIPDLNVPEAGLTISSGVLQEGSIDDLPQLVKTCIDQLFTSLQFAVLMRRQMVDDCYTTANLSQVDIVHYEISKHQDPRKVKPAYQIILAHHARLAMNAVDRQTANDHIFTGYQSAVAIERSEGYELATLELKAFFIAQVIERKEELLALGQRKKSMAAFHVQTTDEGFADLFSYLALINMVHASEFRRIYTGINGNLLKELARRDAGIAADRSTPYARGMAHFKKIYDRHGYCFCWFAKTLCEANFRIMTNLLPLGYLIKPISGSLPSHPAVLLERLADFDCTHVNVYSKIAAAVEHLDLHRKSPYQEAIEVLESL